MTPTNEQIRSAIAQQAAVWFLAHRTGPLAERERQEFMAWLRLSPVNIGEYLAIAGVARDLPAAAAGLPLPQSMRPASASSSARLRRWSIRSWGWPLRLAGAALTVMAVLATAYAVLKEAWVPLLPAAVYQTHHGQQSSWTLADGTVLRLNTDSQVKVRWGRNERVIELERGQIFMRVAHDAQRRLRVQAGGSNLIATGTQFDVYRLRGGVTLTVLDGEVAAYVGEAPSPGGSASAVVVHANEQLRIERSGSTPVPSAVDARAAEAWLNRQIIFHERPLGEVAEEFSRYAPLPIEVDDPRLRQTAISGDFDAYDSESFLAFLRANGDVLIRRQPDRIVVLAR